MANPGQAPGEDREPIESRRSADTAPDQAMPGLPDGAETPSPELPELGELAPESARPSPLDDIAEAEREQMPRD